MESEEAIVATEAEQTARIVKLKSRREVAERTMEFEVERPSGFEFKAGQYAEITWIDPSDTDAEGNARVFSIVTAPDEKTLMFTTRLRDTAFKRVLRQLPVGSDVKLDGPFGDFTLHNNVNRPAILLAGGIGITPFHSIVRRAAHEKLAHKIVLFYANRHPGDAAFLEELRGMEKENPNFTFVPVMTARDLSKSEWTGETGHIDWAMIQRHGAASGASGAGPIYYIAGPPAMVKDLRAMLNKAGVDDDDIRAEGFDGY